MLEDRAARIAWTTTLCERRKCDKHLESPRFGVREARSLLADTYRDTCLVRSCLFPLGPRVLVGDES